MSPGAQLHPAPLRGGADPLRALAAAIFSPTALPELAALQYDTETLAAQLRQAPAEAAFAVQQGLAASASGKLTTLGQARLVVVADQLEELFTIERIFPQVREAFVAALAAAGRMLHILTGHEDSLTSMCAIRGASATLLACMGMISMCVTCAISTSMSGAGGAAATGTATIMTAGSAGGSMWAAFTTRMRRRSGPIRSTWHL